MVRAHPDKGEVGGSKSTQAYQIFLILRCGNAHILMYASRYHALSQGKLPVQRFFANDGAIAQLGERLLCTQEVCGSILHSLYHLFTANTRKLPE